MPTLEPPEHETLEDFSEGDRFIALQQLCTNSLLGYTMTMDERYEPGAIHKFIGQVMEAVESGQCKRVIITMPPRHGKTRLAAEEMGAWYLGKHPEKELIVTSYAQTKSDKISMKIRNRLETADHQDVFPRCRIHPESRRVDDWLTTEGGGCLSAGVGGAITGRGADLFIIDDPIKNREEAESDTTREQIWDWFCSTAYTRLSPTGCMVIIMTRWHEDDLVGRLLNEDYQRELSEAGLDDMKFRVFKFPAISQRNLDQIGRTKGEALWPERWTEKKLNGIRITVGSYEWSALYMCEPRLKGGNYIQREWLKIVPRASVPANLAESRFWDLACSEEQGADNTAGTKGSMWLKKDTKQKIMIISHQEVFRHKWPEAKRRITARARVERIRVGVEGLGGFLIGFEEIRTALLGKILVKAIKYKNQDKLTRALPWIAKAEAGEVWLIQGDWNHALLDECESFPTGTRDDRVDSVTGLYRMLTAPTRSALA